ncbi:DUF3429 domain-containing protein [Rhodocista pekingensis]|uniref:DUF3429 domain-containing protein n=1 Tax=Rhodocista pekingensis TaxID=201185 RepID=A0ABW2KXY6_9PROT
MTTQTTAPAAPIRTVRTRIAPVRTVRTGPFREVPAAAVWLGLAGLIPFYAGALGGWLLPAPYAAHALQYMLYYGVAILSFLGGVHWGLALAGFGAPAVADPEEDPPASMDWTRLGWSTVPVLIGWLALFLSGFAAQITFLLAGFVGMLYGDFRAALAGAAPLWYLKLRRPLTVLVAGALAIALARTAVTLGT